MGLGFGNIPDRKGYLKQAGVQMDAKFLGLTYAWDTEGSWEGFDIEIETIDGKTFRERTFGADINKVYPRTKYVENKPAGVETKLEAFDRTEAEISEKLLHLASCFVRKDVLKEKIKSASDLKTLISKINAAIGAVDSLPRINFLTIWKNSELRQKSVLILADKTKWCEATQLDNQGRPMPANIKLTKYQSENCMIEKYPYQGTQSNTSVATETAAANDMPF